MKINKKIAACFMALLLGVSAFTAFSGCAKELDVSGGIGDQAWLYGVCYPENERSYDPAYDAEAEVQLMANLGVKTVRTWMQIRDLLVSPTQINEEACAKAHARLALYAKHGIRAVGVSHTNFNAGTSQSGKVGRNTTAGSDYIAWLEDYYTAWKTLASEFPEVEYWEIDNETNNSVFMNNIFGEAVFNQDEMAAISADMFYYASRGIHEADPSAQTVMGGLVGFQSGRIKTALEKIYQNIQSGEYGYFYGQESAESASTDPDDYFQIVCWHPYITGAFNRTVFQTLNDEIYEVVLAYEGKHKKVIFSEIGFSNETYSEALAARYVTEMFQLIEEEMPYVESVLYFKMFDYADPSYWTGSYSRYGLFYDPNPARAYTNNESDDIVTPGAPKPQALAFQQAAGASGDLTILQPA